MINRLALEDFAQGVPASPASQTPSTHADPDAALAAFDEGYRDGWEDCARAELEANRRISADLARNLGDLSRGYEAARADVLAALGPLFEEMAARLLPRLAAEAIAPTVLEELRQIADRASTGRVVLMAAPASLPALERLLDAQEDLSVQLVAEPAYAAGQVSLRFAGERRDIDLGGAADRMADALRAFVTPEDNGPTSVATQGAS